MEGEDSNIIGLRNLQKALQAASSSTAALSAVAAFLQQCIGADAVQLKRVGADVADTVQEPAHYAIPLDGQELYLCFSRSTPLKEDEKASAELATSLLAQALPFSKLPSEAQPKLALLDQIGQSIVQSPRLERVLDVLTRRFTDAFPGASLQVLLLNEAQTSLIRRAKSGVEQDAIVAEPVPLEGVWKQVLQEGKTLLVNEENQVGGKTTAKGVLVPIKMREAVTGVLQVDSLDITSFYDQCITYLEMLAGYISIALQTREFVDDAWQRTTQMEMVYGITESARRLKPLRSTLAEIHAQIVRAFNIPSFFVALYHAESGQITFPYAVDNYQELEVEPVSIDHGESLVAWVIRQSEAYVTNNWSPHEAPVEGVREVGSEPGSVLIFPLRAGDEVVGALSVQSDRANMFDEHEQQLLASIADHVAIVVYNARLYSTTQELVDTIAREYMTAASLRQAVASMGASLNLDAVLDRLFLALSELVPFDFASLFLNNGTEAALYKRQFHPELDEPPQVDPHQLQLAVGSLLQRVLQRREPIALPDVQEAPEWEVTEGMDDVRSWIGIPMLAGNEVAGILTLDHNMTGVYGERELWLVSTLVSHASLALQNARLHEEIQRQVAELTTLYESTATITANLEQETVLRTVAREMVNALNVDSCTILVWDKNRQLRTAAHQNQVEDEDSSEAPSVFVSSVSRLANLEDHPIIQRLFDTREVVNIQIDNSPSNDEQALLEEAGLSALLLVPLVQRDRVLGLLALGESKKSRSFNQRDIRLARNLAGQAAVAIEHAYLYSQAQRRVEELSAFHKIVLQLNTPLELEVVLENITESALRLIQASNLHIYIWDIEKDTFTFCSALWRDGRRTPAVEAPRPDGLTATVVRTGEVIVIDNAKEHAFYQGVEAEDWGVEAIAGFPLKHSDKVIGAFTVTYLEPHTFTPDELLLMNLLADQAAVAVENARLFTDAQRRLRSMSALVDMAKQVTGNLKVELVLHTAVQTLQKLLKARASTIALLSEDGQELIVEAAAGIKPQYHRVRIKLGEGVSGRAVKERRLIYIRDTYQEPDFLFFDEVLRSLLVVPLITRNEVVGTLTVDSDRPEAFSESDIQLMTIAAAQASIAIANARLFEALEERAAELADAYEELKENDRLKDELVQNVSHELRTPLTFIRGYVDLLLDGEMGVVTPEQEKALTIVSDKTEEVTRLVEDIISLQRIDEANLIRQTFSMVELLESAIACHQLSADRQGLKLIFERPPQEGIVEADRGRINQVLDNLIGNAMKFSPDGGKIELRMVERHEDVLIVVSDEGIGVPRDKISRIFERFYQIDGSSRRRFGGAGIGLAIVKRIIDAHDGDIWVKSELKKGSAFYFTLPRAK